MNHPEAFRKCHWNAEEREYRFSTAEDGAISASASLELQFDDRSCEEELMAEESGDVHMENAFAEAAICNEVNQEYDILRQTVRIQARRNGVLRGRYTITLRGTSGMEVYLPMHWGISREGFGHAGCGYHLSALYLDGRLQEPVADAGALRVVRRVLFHRCRAGTVSGAYPCGKTVRRRPFCPCRGPAPNRSGHL